MKAHEVHVHNHQQRVPVEGLVRSRVIHRAVERVLRLEANHLPRALDGSVEVSVALVDDETIADLNARFRGKAGPTDVLSFSMDEPPSTQPGETVLLGEIVISVPRALAQAREYGHSFEREVAYLAVHGCLHLVGYDHEDEQARRVMREKEEAALQGVGLVRP